MIGVKAKMDPGMAGMMGGPFGAGGKENFEKMMKEMSEMEASADSHRYCTLLYVMYCRLCT